MTDQLFALAAARGIATEYWSYQGQHVQVSPATIRAILQAMGIACDTEEQVAAALRQAQEAPWLRVLPPCTVNRCDRNTWIFVHVPHGEQVSCKLVLEAGGEITLAQVDNWVDPRWIDGRQIGRATFDIPAGLPLGWHTIVATLGDGSRHSAPFANCPAHLELPRLRDGRAWGLMAQLYSVRSRHGWGIGDAVDLADLARYGARQGADFVLINPVHAGEPVAPLTPSPYLPASRQFVNPIYIRPEAIAEFARLGPRQRDKVERLRQEAALGQDQRLDRNQCWRAKIQALQMIHALGLEGKRLRDFQDWRDAGGKQLQQFAAWSALVEAHGFPLPRRLRDAEGEAVRLGLRPLGKRVEFFTWLQWVVSEQLAQAHRTALEAGMRIGVMHDLAVGVHKAGADVWADPQYFAAGIEVGAPADMYNQLGQNWSQPPWRPDTLEESAYQPLRQLVRRLAGMGGALRLDHIMGLFRLWWIPPTAPTPASGTYVHYNREHMVGIVALEAHRAGAVVVGEDLGTVEPGVREYLAERGFLGTAVAWFEYEGDMPRRAEHYRAAQLATVNTHDLPPTAGYLRDEHVRLRAELGLLSGSAEDEYARSAAERERMVQTLIAQGVLAPEQRDDLDAVCLALHRLVAQTPSALVGVSLADIAGERRAQNQPGTNNEYPNWRIPLSDARGRALYLEDLQRAGGCELTRVVEEGLHPSGS